VMADVGAWIMANMVANGWIESLSYLVNDPNASYNCDLCLPPICGAMIFIWNALVLILPLSLLLVALRRPGRAFPALVERWLGVATVAVVLAAFFAAVDEELANFLLTDLWQTLQLVAWFLAGCAFVVALVSIVREHTQRGAGTQP
jgi:hypothetical protein